MSSLLNDELLYIQWTKRIAWRLGGGGRAEQERGLALLQAHLEEARAGAGENARAAFFKWESAIGDHRSRTGL